MSINKSGEIYTYTCDFCGEASSDKLKDYYTAVLAARENGGKRRKIKGRWRDKCAKCMRDPLRWADKL